MIVATIARKPSELCDLDGDVVHTLQLIMCKNTQKMLNVNLLLVT
jgi:hypothetical protein